MKTAAARFSALQPARMSVLDKAREASRLTIPGIVPEHGQNEHYISTQPYQSVGAQGLRSLAARLLSTLFPVNVPFFRLELDSFAAAGLQADKAKTDTLLSQVSETTSALMDERNVRPIMAEALRQLIVAGNVVVHFPVDGMPRIFRLDQFVIKRDRQGDWTDIVIQEKIYPSNLSDEIRAFLALKVDPEKAEQKLDIFTCVEKRDGQVTQFQEINGKKLPDSEAPPTPADKAGWLAPRWLHVPGSDYGRSHVTEYFGDLQTLEEMGQSFVQWAALASRVIYLVDPNSTIDIAEMAAASSGDYLSGNSDHVSAVSLDKSQDFSVLQTISEVTADRVNRAFLVQSFRDAERVTAEEVRAQSEELENTLGGTFSVLASELQTPIANRFLYIAEQLNRIPEVPAGIKPKVITGLAALGRAAEVNRLRTWASDAIGIIGPEAFLQNVNAAAFLTILGIEHGVSSLPTLLKTDEQKAQEQEQAMMAQATQAAAPGFMDAAMKAATDQPA